MGFWHSLLVRDYYPLRYSPGGHGINHSSFRYQLVYQTMIPYPNVSSASISTAISHSITIPRGINALFASNTLTEGDEDNKTPWILSEMWELVVAGGSAFLNWSVGRGRGPQKTQKNRYMTCRMWHRRKKILRLQSTDFNLKLKVDGK